MKYIELLLCITFCIVFQASAARAAPPNDPVSSIYVTGGIDKDHPNGQVAASVITGNPPVLYIGGEFTAVRPLTGHGVVVNANTGAADPAFPRVDGDVNAVAPDGAGGWYLAGAFTGVGGTSVRNVAHIKADKTLDTAFNPDPAGLVRALVLSPDGTTLYIGGDFEGFGDDKLGPKRLAAIDTATGQHTDWDPKAPDNVRALAISKDGAILYVGGDFHDPSTIGAAAGAVRNHLAALLTSDGTVTDWNPDAGARVQTMALKGNGNVLYVGGNFHLIGGQPRNNAAAIKTTDTGTIKPWNPDANGVVFTLVVRGGTVYAGGNFTHIGGADRNRVAALAANTGIATTWNPDANSTVQAIAVSASTVYIGGLFAFINGNPQTGVSRNNLAAVDRTSGAVLPWNPNFNGPNGKDGGTVLALARQGNKLYAGGKFDSVGGAVARNYLAAFDAATGSLRTDINPSADGPVYALAAVGNQVYVGGEFPSFQGGALIIKRIARLNAQSGQPDLSWHPDAEGGPVRALAVSPDGKTIYAGGEFSTIAGALRARLAALDAASGSASPLFDPGVDGPVLALTTLGSDRLYVGGAFSHIGALMTARANLALLKGAGTGVSNQGSVQTWDPSPNGPVHTILVGGTTLCTPPANRQPTVYIGGEFTLLTNGSIPGRNHVAALKTTGTPATVCSWNPGTDSTVHALARSGDTLFLGGDFTSAGALSRCRLAAVDVVTASATAWNPGVNTAWNQNKTAIICPANSNSVRTLTLSNSLGFLYAGGAYSRIQGTASPELDPPGLQHNNLAAFKFPTLDSVVWPLSDMVHVGEGVGGIQVVVSNQTATTAQQVSLVLKTAITGGPTFVYLNPDGLQDTPADIPPLTSRTFLIGFVALNNEVDPPTEVKFGVEGTNTPAVGSITGVNTLFVSAVDPNIDIANIVTTVDPGTITYPLSTGTCTGTGSFIVSATNFGDTQTIVVKPKGTDPFVTDNNVVLKICQMTPGDCTPTASSVTLSFTGGGTTISFKVAVEGVEDGAIIPDDPDNNRVNVEFRKDTTGGSLRGLGSTAVFTNGSCQ